MVGMPRILTHGGSFEAFFSGGRLMLFLAFLDLFFYLILFNKRVIPAFHYLCGFDLLLSTLLYVISSVVLSLGFYLSERGG